MKSPPNIVYIFADDMGYGDMACNNPDSRIPTPNLDRLATQGMRFTDAHAPSSICTPSRYALLTGRYCWRSPLKQGVLWEWDPALIEPDRPTVAGFLREQGYRTACIGKWHLGWDWPTKDGRPANKGVELGVYDQTRIELGKNIDFSRPIKGGPADRGFDYYFGQDLPNFPPYTWLEQDRVQVQPTEEKPEDIEGLLYPSTCRPGAMAPGWSLEEVMPELTRRVVRYIEESGEAPFFLYFPMTAPHTPIVPTEQFRGMSQAGEYGDFVCEVDWCVGQVVEALDRKGIAEDTLLIFASDNGPEVFAYNSIMPDYRHFSNGHLRGIKYDAWEGGHRVPFIARWPGKVPTGKVCSQLFSLSDLMATCAEILGVPLPSDAGEDSVSMLPLLLHGDATPPTRRFAVHHSLNGKFAIRCGDWVFIDAPSGGDAREPDWYREERGYADHDFPGELFNLRDDISERHNRYGEYPEVVGELSELLARAKEGADPSAGAGVAPELLTE